MATTARCAFVALVFTMAAGCSRSPSPSHVASAYRGKLQDDTLVEASTTVLVTNRDVVIALDCTRLKEAIADDDAASVERAVAGGTAARLPAGVTIYTPPFSPANPGAAPLVVTDDKYAGKLCTPNSYDVVKS
jgi:hypothetical protein